MSGVEIQSRGDFRTNLTARIIEALEAGTAPWQKPWDGAAGGFFPVNPITGNAYKGGNAFALMAAGYDDPRWCTFNQASANEWKVRKGEKATWVEYWKWSDSIEQVDKISGEVTKVDVALESPRVFYAKVFNLSQMENVPELVRKQPVWDSHEMAERVIEGSGAAFFHDQADRAFYSVTKDEIHLPERVAFSDVGSYYATKLHELGHWTGHGSRMNREFGTSRGDVLYAKEELRAELASLFLADRLGLPFEVGNHAAYVGSWIEVLKADKNEIFRAAKDAEKIVEYVMGLGLEQSVSVENEVEQDVFQDGVQESKPVKAGRVYLNVPYTERGEVKVLGARWDKAKELWYVPSTKELTGFQQWLKPVSEADIVADFVKSAGVAGLILKDAPVADGKWYYVQVVGDKGTEQSGSYKLELGSKPNGFAKNFKFPDMSVGWKYENAGVDKVANANINESVKAAQAKREQDDLAEKLRVAGMVEVRLAKLPVAGPEHEYLVRKGVGAYGLLRQGLDVVMPLGDVDGKVWSSQTIKPDGTKLNLKGGRKTGSFHLIGDRATLGTGPIAIVEGYATGASVYECTRWHTAVAVDSGNLVVVAKALRERYPEAEMVICGDDDRFLRCPVAWTKEGEYIKGAEVKNAGREKALEAAEAVGGRAVFPEFDDGDWKGTDFNDIHAGGLSACVLGKVALELKAKNIQSITSLQTAYKVAQDSRHGIRERILAAQTDLERADAKNDLDAIWEAGVRLDDVVIAEVERRLSACEMAVFKGVNLTYAMHPSTDGKNAYQVTTYSDAGALGDTRYLTVKDAVKDVQLSIRQLLDAEDAAIEMNRVGQAEGNYQDRKQKILRESVVQTGGIDVSAKAKEPWEMTQEDYIESQMALVGVERTNKTARWLESKRDQFGVEWGESREAAAIAGKPVKVKPAWMRAQQEWTESTGNGADEHYERVKNAVELNKPVPNEVLADYPNLNLAQKVNQEVVLAVASQEIVTVKDVYGRTHRVRQSDLAGDTDRISTVRKNGDIVSGEEIPRSILNQLGEKSLSEPLAINEPDVERGRYRGAVVDDTGARVVQNQGKGTAVSHEKERLEGEVKVGQKVEIGYEGGRGTVRSLERDGKDLERM